MMMEAADKKSEIPPPTLCWSPAATVSSLPRESLSRCNTLPTNSGIMQVGPICQLHLPLHHMLGKFEHLTFKMKEARLSTSLLYSFLYIVYNINSMSISIICQLLKFLLYSVISLVHSHSN